MMSGIVETQNVTSRREEITRRCRQGGKNVFYVVATSVPRRAAGRCAAPPTPAAAPQPTWMPKIKGKGTLVRGSRTGGGRIKWDWMGVKLGRTVAQGGEVRAGTAVTKAWGRRAQPEAAARAGPD